MRDLPHSLDAESAVLGAVLGSPEALTRVADWIDYSAFYEPSHKAAFQAATELAAMGRPFDPVTVWEWADSQGLGNLLSLQFLVGLEQSTPSAANVVAYAEIVVEKAKLRAAIDIGKTMQRSALGAKAESAMVIAEASQALAQLQNATNRGGLVPARTGVKEWFTEFTERYNVGASVTGLPTPWKDLNDATHGLQDGELIFLAARPNMGKSVAGDMVAFFTAARCAEQDDGAVALFALESTRAKVIRRGVSCIGDVPHDFLVAPSADAVDAELYCARSTNAAGVISKANLLIDDTPGLTWQQIVSRARRANLQKRLRLVVIDHFHIIRMPGKNRVQEIGEASRGLKALAKELGCPVLALAQLNRGVAGRQEKRPQMTDLRESGEIEQDADLVMFLHREDYYDPNTHLRSVVELSIGKGRDVATGTVIYLENQYSRMRLADWTGPIPQAATMPASKGGFRRNAA